MTTEPQRPSVYGLRRPSLRKRVLGTIAALSAAGLLGAGVPALLLERERVESRIERVLAQEIREFTELANAGVDPQTGSGFSNVDRLFTVSMERNVPDEHETHIGFLPDSTIVQSEGVASLHEDQQFRRVVSGFAQPGFGEYDSAVEGRVVFAVMPVVQGDERGYYVALYCLDRELAEMGDSVRSYAAAAVIAWLVMLLAAWLLVRRLLRPMEELRVTAESITDTDLSRRLHVRGDDEVGALGRQFNSMLDRLQEALGAQRGMLDDAGHELRTPITVVRGHLELMDSADPADVEQVRALAIDELDRMGVLVEDLMVLAKSRRPDFLRRQTFDVAALIEDTRAKAGPLGERRWLLDQLMPTWIDGDPRRLTQALLQLASNAMAVTGPGDTIGFGCARGPRGVQLWVRDTGPGVPAAERHTIFARHSSGSTGREGGSGLGLAIVMAIAQAHGGTAWVGQAGPAGGARFVIDLPERVVSAQPGDDDPAAPTAAPVPPTTAIDCGKP